MITFEIDLVMIPWVFYLFILPLIKIFLDQKRHNDELRAQLRFERFKSWLEKMLE